MSELDPADAVREALNFRGETFAEARQQLVNVLKAQKSWLTDYAEAYVDEFAEMATPHAPAKAREVSEVDVERALTMFDAECWRHELSPMGALDRVGAMRAALATFAEGAE